MLLGVVISLAGVLLSLIFKGFKWLLKVPHLIDSALVAGLIYAVLYTKYTFTENGPAILVITMIIAIFIMANNLPVVYWIISVISTIVFGFIIHFVTDSGWKTAVAVIIWFAIRWGIALIRSDSKDRSPTLYG